MGDNMAIGGGTASGAAIPAFGSIPQLGVDAFIITAIKNVMAEQTVVAISAKIELSAWAVGHYDRPQSKKN
jgi:hypothetical protein